VGIVIAIIVVVVIAIGVGLALGLRRRSRPAPAPITPPRPARPAPAPMTGLEDALSQVTDRSGTTMRDRLDAETDHVDRFRVTDDTEPLLRRALDQVEPAPRVSDDDADAVDDDDAPTS
jgi:hypothetical protein